MHTGPFWVRLRINDSNAFHSFPMDRLAVHDGCMCMTHKTQIKLTANVFYCIFCGLFRSNKRKFINSPLYCDSSMEKKIWVQKGFYSFYPSEEK